MYLLPSLRNLYCAKIHCILAPKVLSHLVSYTILTSLSNSVSHGSSEYFWKLPRPLLPSAEEPLNLSLEKHHLFGENFLSPLRRVNNLSALLSRHIFKWLVYCLPSSRHCKSHVCNIPGKYKYIHGSYAFPYLLGVKRGGPKGCCKLGEIKQRCVFKKSQWSQYKTFICVIRHSSHL